jgi:hypothetical protein
VKEIPLTQGQVAKVDDADFEWLNRYKWCAYWNERSKSFYAKRNSLLSDEYQHKTSLLMHRLIMGAKRGQEVDHDNHDTLDNQRTNLRVCTTFQNHGNVRKQQRNTSGFKGVSWHKHTRKWRAYIMISGKQLHLGLHEFPEQAARAYDCKARELFGEFALTNF